MNKLAAAIGILTFVVAITGVALEISIWSSGARIAEACHK